MMPKFAEIAAHAHNAANELAALAIALRPLEVHRGVIERSQTICEIAARCDETLQELRCAEGALDRLVRA
jgi:hypothetical protein